MDRDRTPPTHAPLPTIAAALLRFEAPTGAPAIASDPVRETEHLLEPLYLILVHNDDTTPFQYVLNILARVFLLSDELAEHVAMTAHQEGRAIVMLRPRADEAKRLIAVAHSRARMDGYPLSFSMEPES